MIRALVLFCLSLAIAACGELLPSDPLAIAALSATDAGASSAIPIEAATPASHAGASPPATTPASPAAEAGAIACTPIDHDNGIGQTYRSCDPLGTHTEASAMAACRAFIQGGGGTYCQRTVPSFCGGVAILSGGQIGSVHALWTFAGAIKGHVVLTGAASGCPIATDPTWN